MSDRFLGFFAMILAGSMAVGGWGYAAPVDYEPVGPRAFPLLLALCMVVCGLWLALRSGEAVQWPRGTQLRHISVCSGAILVYALLFQLLGFVIATALVVLPLGRIFGGSWRQCALYGAGLGVVLYLLFDKVLDVVLPLGVINWN